ncbi:MAG: hypothetical protein J5524_08555 [Bacteroidaceae bacterium]|nr:hypothetical protein [Bacteroidaceae bacterium]MBO4841132.1 hypothetical protein [Bacteroidaceae bacterium]
MRFAQDDSFRCCLPYGIVHFNFHDRSELTSIFTSSYPSLLAVLVTLSVTSSI